jgi:hypothetical protein
MHVLQEGKYKNTYMTIQEDEWRMEKERRIGRHYAYTFKFPSPGKGSGKGQMGTYCEQVNEILNTNEELQ